MNRILATASLVASFVLLTACSSGDNNSVSHPLRVQVSGLQSQHSIELLNTLDVGRTELLAISANGSHTFKIPIDQNGSYEVEVAHSGDLTCEVTNGSAFRVTTTPPPVTVRCFESIPSDDLPAQFSVGGAISGLTVGQSFLVKLFDGDTNPTRITANGAYQLTTQVARGGNYQLQVFTQPDGLFCVPDNGSRWDVQSNITDENITCKPYGAKWRISTNVTGLSAGNTLTIANQRKGQLDDLLTFNSDATKTFGQAVVDGGDYNVAVTSIGLPTQQTCLVTSDNGSGKASSDITVQIECKNIAAPMHPISAKVSGLFEGNELCLKENIIGQWTVLSKQNSQKTFYFQAEHGTRYSVSMDDNMPFCGVPPPTAQHCEFVNGSNIGTVNGPVLVEVNCGLPKVKTIYSTPRSDDKENYLGYPVGLIKGNNDGYFYGLTTKDVLTLTGDDFQFTGSRSGSLFKLDQDGDMIRLGLFAGASCFGNVDGAGGLYPSAPTGVVQQNNGSLLGMTFAGAKPVGSGADYECTPANADQGGNLLFRGAEFSYANGVYSQFVRQIGRDNNAAQNAGPVAGLIRDNIGIIYGVTYGTIFKDDTSFTHAGTVFKLIPDGTWIPLKVFIASKEKGDYWNGFLPSGRLMLDGDYIYGTTERGGTGDAGTVFRINLKNNSFKVIAHFEEAETAYQRPAIGVSSYRDPYAIRYSALVKGSDGNLYGTRRDSGVSNPGAGAIYRLKPNGSEFTFELLYTFPANDGTPVSELVEINGMFYGVLQGDQSAGNGAKVMGSVYRFNPQTKTIISLHTFKGAQLDNDGNVPNTGLIKGDNGRSLFGTTKFGGANSSGAIYKLMW